MTARRIMLTLVGALLALALYPLASYAAYGGVWVPADGYGDGDGFWLVVAPEQDMRDHVGSEAVADGGSVGRLEDADGRDDARASICDNKANGRDAMAFTFRLNDNFITRSARTFDGNGVNPGCGSEIIGFSGERHRAYENGDFGGGGGTSSHMGF